MKMTYREFETVLLEDHYSFRWIRYLFNVVKDMDKESRMWVIRWVLTGELPSERVEGITAEQLVKKYGCKPMNALIILDWLKTDPQSAKYFLMKMPSGSDPSEEIGQEMLDFLQSHSASVTPIANCEESEDVIE